MLIGSIALLALAFLVVLGPLIVDTLGAFFPSVEQAHSLLTFLRIGIAALMLASSLILAHLILPAHRVGFRDILPGVALTFVASIAFGELFGAYLSEYLRNYISTYAGLASVMIALVYLYWVALLFVFGGELNAAIIRARQARAVWLTRRASVAALRESGPRGSHNPLALKYFNRLQTAACCSSSISLGSRCMRRISDGFLPSMRGRIG